MASERDDLDQEKSLYLFQLLCSVGYSKTEVDMRRTKWRWIEFLDNTFQQFDPGVSHSVHSGSAVEGMTGSPYYSGERSDYDSVKVLRSTKVIPYENSTNVLWSSSPENIVVSPLNDEMFPGYCHLIVREACSEFKDVFICKKGVYFYQNWLSNVESLVARALGDKSEENRHEMTRTFKETNLKPHGPALQERASESADIIRYISELSNRSVDVTQEEMTFEIDAVFCLRVNWWPSEASEWVTRPRATDWPSGRLIKSIVAKGCMLAPVGHSDSPDRQLQWRISFNIAEKDLIGFFNQMQLLCYAFLKLMLKDFLTSRVKDVLSSYYMKTVVFWCSEENKELAEGQNNDRFIQLIKVCLMKLKTFIVEKNIPNYFVKTRNMFSTKFTDGESKEITEAIDKMCSDVLEAIYFKTFTLVFRCSNGHETILHKLEQRSILTARTEVGLALFERYYFFGSQSIVWNNYAHLDAQTSMVRMTKILQDLRVEPVLFEPFVKLTKNCLGVLKYCQAMTATKSREQVNGMKGEALAQLEDSESADCTCAPLRHATILLGEGKMTKCLQLCQKVLSTSVRHVINTRGDYMKYLFHLMNICIQEIQAEEDSEVLEESVNDTVKELIRNNCEEIIQHRSLSALATTLLNSSVLARQGVCFDVIFMTAEIGVLPRAVQLELINVIPQLSKDISGVRLHPIVYAMFLECLCYRKSNDSERLESTIDKFESTIPTLTTYYRSSSHNLLSDVYRNSPGKEKDAARHMIKSLLIKPTYDNVSYGYLLRILNILTEMTLR